MNYIAEIKAFNGLVLLNRLSTGQISLWYALMYLDNKCGWREWFSVPNETLRFFTGLSREGVYRARNRLKQLGAIDFRESCGGKAPRYRLSSLIENPPYGVPESTHAGAREGTCRSVQDKAPFPKPDKTKPDSAAALQNVKELFNQSCPSLSKVDASPDGERDRTSSP